MSQTKKFLFLIGWVNGAESNGMIDTGINENEDLYKEYLKGNDAVISLEIEVPADFNDPKKLAWTVGKAEAFHVNFTGDDTLSWVLQEGEYSLVGETPKQKFGC